MAIKQLMLFCLALVCRTQWTHLMCCEWNLTAGKQRHSELNDTCLTTQPNCTDWCNAFRYTSKQLDWLRASISVSVVSSTYAWAGHVCTIRMLSKLLFSLTTHWICDTRPARHQTHRYLHHCKASLPCGQYQTTLLSDNTTMCENNLSE